MTTYVCVSLLFLLFFTFKLVSANADLLVTDIVYIDVKIESEQTKRIEIGLFGKTVPLTVNNFVALAKGHTSDDGQVFGYTGTTFDVIIKDAFIEGGDVTHGKGSYSIYGPQFKDENFELQGYGAGWVMMANFGSDTNASNFVIILRPVPWWLVNKYVVFGKVIKGMSWVRRIENLDPIGSNASRSVRIEKSGVIRINKPFLVEPSEARN